MGLDSVPTLAFIQGSEVASEESICVITRVSTLLITTQVSSGLKKAYAQVQQVPVPSCLDDHSSVHGGEIF